MCGICGYIYSDRSKRHSEAVLKNMTATLSLRGPDDEGYYLKDNAALGHRRLSIIDLSTGHQPMFNEDGSIVIVFNGEIYNFQDIKEALIKKGHVFKTHSDTEVIIHAYEEYGEDCLKLFNGMFAFALWDSKSQRLFLARDRFGKKPLYYAIFDNQFIFGSELKAILKHPSVRKEIDYNALSKYLAYEYIPAPLTIFKNIYKMESAQFMYVKDGVCKTNYYWDLTFKRYDNFDLKEAEARLVALLKESVRKRLISDVPIGVFLSGGMDSSSVVAMMAEMMAPKDIKTFSIGFKEKSYDESSDAKLIAEHFGTDHHEEILEPDTMLDIFPKILDLLDEPFADSSIIPTYLVSRFTRQHVKVALGGDGGDELLLGYSSFVAHRMQSYFSAVPDFMVRWPLEIFTKMIPMSDKYMSLNFKGKRLLKGLSFPPEVRHQAWVGALVPEEQKKLFLPASGLDYDPLKVYDTTGGYYRRAKEVEALEKAIYLYVKTYMTDDILTKVDRASMANSLEVRAPFLDTDFAEFTATIPCRFKLKGMTTKWILKDAMRDKLPKETLNKSKQGFAVPVGKWLKNDLKHLLLEAFDKDKIEREGIFDYGYIKNMLKEYTENKNDMRKEIWDLFMFELWYDRWMK